MHVRCEKCFTIYEFDDSLVPEEGIPVQCTNCKYVFRVRRRHPSPIGGEGQDEGGEGGEDPALLAVERVWQLRKAGSGEIMRFRDFATLQQWIVERRAVREDEISRTGENWKQLAGIAELGAFFRLVDQATAAGVPIKTERKERGHTTQPYELRMLGKPEPPPAEEPPPPAPAEEAAPRPEPRKRDEAKKGRAASEPRRAEPEPLAVETAERIEIDDLAPEPESKKVEPKRPAPESKKIDLAKVEVALEPEPSPPRRTPVPAPRRRTPDPFAATQHPSGGMAVPAVEIAPLPPPPVSSRMAAAAIPPEDDLDEDELPRGGPRRGTLLLVGVLLLVVGLAAFLVAFKRDRIRALFAHNQPPKVSESYRRGFAYLDMDSYENLRLAEQEFLRARGSDEANPKPIAALAELDSLWAGYLRDEAKRIQDPARAAAASRDAQARLDEAKRYSSEAVLLAADDPDVNRAMATYLLASGQPADKVEEFLRRCIDKRADDPAAAYLRGALFHREGKPVEARRPLEDASRLQRKSGPQGLLRAETLLAEIELAAGERDEARVIIQRVLDANPRHERARALLADLDAPRIGDPTPDAGPPAATPPTVAYKPVPDKPLPDEHPGPGTTPAPTPPEKGKPEKPPVEKPPVEKVESRGYSSAIAAGNKLLERGKGKEALKHFEKALEERPDGTEANIGVAYCFLDMEKYGAAIDRFKHALSLKAGDGDAIIGLAEAYKMRNNKPKALEYYREYLSTNPSGPKAAMAQKNAREIEANLTVQDTPTP